MSYLDPTTRAMLTQQLATKQAQLQKLNTAYTAALDNVEVESYSFDSGEGKQSARRRKPEEIMKEIRNLELQVNRLMMRLNGSGVVNMNLRRRRWGV